MPGDIGPYDGRKARRKRCDGCVKRKIKCHGGIPCENCRRTNRLCDPPKKPVNSVPVFVGNGIKKSGCQRTDVVTSSTPRFLWPGSDDRNHSFFFTLFLPMNTFASRRLPIDTELLSTAETTPALRDAIQALSILRRQQMEQTITAGAHRRNETCVALQVYSRSVRCMQKQIASSDFQGDPPALWTTFLLGLFELMRDPTGQNWLSHFLHGTCTMLRLQNPAILTSPGLHGTRKRTFFLATRIFEIARSLIYTSPTFLSEPEWMAALQQLWETVGSSLWHPKEALFDILPKISDLGFRAIQFCVNVAQLSEETRYTLVQSLADKGLRLRQSLELWCIEAMTWKQSVLDQSTSHTTGIEPDHELLIGFLYYNAISIYLSGIFDYHPYWRVPSAPRAPILPRDKIILHVSEILRLSQQLLASGISGLLLFFPLRVAGARAADACSRENILDLLQVTEARGFVVADAFTTDLRELWARNDILR